MAGALAERGEHVVVARADDGDVGVGQRLVRRGDEDPAEVGEPFLGEGEVGARPAGRC